MRFVRVVVVVVVVVVVIAQYPFLLLLLTIIIGVAAAVDRNFEDVRVFPEETRIKGQGDDKEEKEKSYTELYKEMKVTALTMEKSVGRRPMLLLLLLLLLQLLMLL